MKKSLKLIICFSFLVLFVGCDENSPVSLLFDPPECKLSVVDKVDYSPGEFAKIKIKVKNDSDPIAYNVWCEVECKRNSTIIERKTIHLGTLESEESILDEVWLSKIKTHKEYNRIEFYLSWEDAEGEYYDKYYYSD